MVWVIAIVVMVVVNNYGNGYDYLRVIYQSETIPAKYC